MKTKPNPLKDSLVSLGLSEKEAAVYLALLELGRSTVSKISRKANVNRSTGYVILDSLINKGLAHISGKEPTQEYVAESPDNLATMFRREREKIDADIENSLALARELKSVQKSEGRPQVKFYEGVEGLKQVYEDTLSTTEVIRAFGAYEGAENELSGYFPKYYQRRAEKNISVRGIAPKTSLSQTRQSEATTEKRELLLVPADKFTPSPEIDIYNNKVMIASWREKLGIIIESAEIADAMKKLFELAWIGAKQVKEN